MKQNVKVRNHNGKKIVSVLVLSGIAIQGIVYEPVQKRVLQSDAPYVVPSGHNPYTDYKAWASSEHRKAAIMRKVAEIRQEIRQKAQQMMLEQNEIMSKLVTSVAAEVENRQITSKNKLVIDIEDAVTNPVKVQIKSIRGYKTETV